MGKLRKRKWKIVALKHFVNRHILRYQRDPTIEGTSSRAAENLKPPRHRRPHLAAAKGEADDNDDDDDDENRHRDNVGVNVDEGGGKDKKTERKTSETKREKKEKKDEDEKKKMFLDVRRLEDSVLEAENVNVFVKIGFLLENLSLSASDLNVVIFFFLLPWIRRLWRR